MSMCNCCLLRCLGLSGNAEYCGRLCSAANTDGVLDKEVPDDNVPDEDVSDEEGTRVDENADTIGGSVRCTTSQ